MNKTFDLSFLKGDYLHMSREVDEDGKVVEHSLFMMKDGIIKDNPFSSSFAGTASAAWLIENKDRALHKIRSVMSTQGLGTHEADECYEFAIWRFANDPKLEFDPNHFDNQNKSYTISIFCLHQLALTVYHYRNEMRNRLQNTVYLVDRDSDENEVMPKKSISYDLLSKTSFEEERQSYGYNEVAEFDELQDILDVIIPYYNDEFRMLGLVNFDFKKYVYHTFLSDKHITLERKKVLSEESLSLVAEALGMTEFKLKTVNKLVSELLRNRTDIFGDLREPLHRLVDGKVRGWVPIWNE